MDHTRRHSIQEQLVKIETLTFERLKREDEAARIRTEQSLRAKIEASQRIERTRAEAAEAVAAVVIGIDYAMMSGGDVSPLGSDAVTQIHQLFNWAAKSPKGVVLFIDEAECFLGSFSDAAYHS